MVQTTTMTVRLPADIVERLEGLARSTDRTKSFLASKAIEEFVTTQEWQVQAIKQAVQAADVPGARFIDHEDLVAKRRRR
ncbi:MAG: CopG family ribbon-helix-helix protein [Candidatus Methylomirabilia bacterium]